MSEQRSYSEQMQKLSPKPGDLLVINVETILTPDQREKMHCSLSPVVENLGCRMIVLEKGISLSLHVDPAAQFAEQQRQTALLERMVDQQAALLQALAEEESDDPDAQPLTYMDGTPCR